MTKEVEIRDIIMGYVDFIEQTKLSDGDELCGIFVGGDFLWSDKEDASITLFCLVMPSANKIIDGTKVERVEFNVATLIGTSGILLDVREAIQKVGVYPELFEALNSGYNKVFGDMGIFLKNTKDYIFKAYKYDYVQQILSEAQMALNDIHWPHEFYENRTDKENTFICVQNTHTAKGIIDNYTWKEAVHWTKSLMNTMETLDDSLFNFGYTDQKENYLGDTKNKFKEKLKLEKQTIKEDKIKFTILFRKKLINIFNESLERAYTSEEVVSKM